VTTFDNDRSWKPDILVDILEWDYRSVYKPHYFDVVVCCPPCTEFSRAKTTKERDLILGDSLVLKALEIIQYLQPTRWWLENPRNGLIPSREYMAGYPYVDADYCQYSDWCL